MTKSWKPRRRKRRYERSSAVVLSQARLGRAPTPLHKIRWRRRGLWMLLALAVAGGGLATWLTLDARFYVYDAQIAGNRRLSHQEIFEASGLSGLHILWARSGAIESRILESLPSLETVEASCRLPSACSISVVERRPRVLWNDNGELWWIDEEGAVFSAQGSGGELGGLGDVSGQWQVTGPLPRDEGQVPAQLDQQVHVALAELWESGRELPMAFQYSSEQGLSFVDEHGWRIIVGRGPGMMRRLRVLERVVAHLESEGVTPRFVDVRFPEAPYYAPATDDGASLRQGGYAVVSSLLIGRGPDRGATPL